MQAIFVYGTLRQGFPNEHILTRIGGEFENAWLKGRYINVGWGASMGCPAMIPDPNGESVKGQVFRSEYLPDNWAVLDEFEGDEYQRVMVEVNLERGVQSAAVYVAKSELNKGLVK